MYENFSSNEDKYKDFKLNEHLDKKDLSEDEIEEVSNKICYLLANSSCLSNEINEMSFCVIEEIVQNLTDTSAIGKIIFLSLSDPEEAGEQLKEIVRDYVIKYVTNNIDQLCNLINEEETYM